MVPEGADGLRLDLLVAVAEVALHANVVRHVDAHVDDEDDEQVAGDAWGAIQ